MITATLFRHTPLSLALRGASLRSLPIKATRCSPHQWLSPPLQRLQSTTPPSSRKPTPNTATKSTLIYLAPTLQTQSIGLTRLTTLVLFALGTGYTLLNLVPDPLIPLHIKLLYLLGSTLPVTAAMMSGPCVSAIRLHIPSSVPKRREELLRWANNVPPNTRLTMTYMRFRPWPVKKQFVFRDLRRLEPNWRRLANVEHIPEVNRDAMDQSRVYGWFVRRFVGRYWVNMNSSGRYWVNMNSSGRDRSEVPGVWERMWRQTPLVGEREVAVDEAAERRREEVRRAKIPGPRVPPPPLKKERERVVRK